MIKALTGHAEALAVLIAMGLLRYVVSYAKFGREASYHLWSSKVWGFALFLGFYALLVLHSDGVWIYARNLSRHYVYILI